MSVITSHRSGVFSEPVVGKYSPISAASLPGGLDLLVAIDCDGKSKGIYRRVYSDMFDVEKYIDIFDISEEIYRKIIQIDRSAAYWYKYNTVYYQAAKADRLSKSNWEVEEMRAPDISRDKWLFL